MAASTVEPHAGLQDLLHALRAVRDGDFSVRLPASANGDTTLAEIASAFNEVVERNETLNTELARVGRLVGREGRMHERFVTDAPGAWAETAGAVNRLVE